MKEWPPKDWRAMVALVFSVLGAAVLTLLTTWLCYLLATGAWTAATEGSRARSIGAVAIISALAVGLVLLGLGMAINRRSLSAKWGDRSLDWQGGDPETQTPGKAAQATAAAAEQKADEIAASEEAS